MVRRRESRPRATIGGILTQGGEGTIPSYPIRSAVRYVEGLLCFILVVAAIGIVLDSADASADARFWLLVAAVTSLVGAFQVWRLRRLLRRLDRR